MKKKVAKYDRLMKQLTKPRYVGNHVGDSIICFAASFVPQCGYYGLSSVIPFIIGSIFAYSNNPIDNDLLLNSQPSRDTIQRLVEQNVVDTILLTQESIRKIPYIYISFDKGNKKGNKNLTRYICWYDVDTKQVKTFLLDVCCTDESTDDIANTMARSLKRIFSDGIAVRIYGWSRIIAEMNCVIRKMVIWKV